VPIGKTRGTFSWARPRLGTTQLPTATSYGNFNRRSEGMLWECYSREVAGSNRFMGLERVGTEIGRRRPRPWRPVSRLGALRRSCAGRGDRWWS
jgi:hypothetical protein